MRWHLKVAWVLTITTTALVIILALYGQASVLTLSRLFDKAELVSFPPSSKFSSKYDEYIELVLGGFTPVELSKEGLSALTCSSIVFAGHTYPKNGYIGGSKPLFPDPDNALSAFLKFIETRKPDRVVFGGDSVWSPNEEELTWLLNIKRRVGESKFLIGNHDVLNDQRGTRVERLHKEIFGLPYEAVTVDDVLLIYFQSIKRDGRHGIPPHQIEFLKNIIRNNSHKYAILFLHSILWEDENELRNSEYFDVEKINKDWNEQILPLLNASRVKMVVAGDGGVRRPGRVREISGIKYVVSGWPNNRGDFPVEWLDIGLCDNGPRLARYRLLNGTLYRSVD